jgi:hypothetical protein
LSLYAFNCKEETSITIIESNFTSKNNEFVQVNIPFISNESDVTKLINSAISKTVISSLQIGEPDDLTSETIEESITKFNDEYNDFINDFPESSQLWEAEIDGEAMFQSEDIISIAITSYVNTGGAHGNLNISFLNFDVETGRSISNIDLFKDIESFKQIAKTHFDKVIENEGDVFDINTFKLPANIGFSDEGIILLYNTYEVAPYSTGIIEFEIPYNEIDSFLVFNNF